MDFVAQLRFVVLLVIVRQPFSCHICCICCIHGVPSGTRCGANVANVATGDDGCGHACDLCDQFSIHAI